MKKRMLIMLVGVGVLFGAIVFYQLFKAQMIKKYMAKNSNPIIAVSTIDVEAQPWQPKITAVGTLRAIKGVNVTTELSGMVRDIYFKPGTPVEKGTKLVKLNDDTEVATLQALLAKLELAKITYERDSAQYQINAVSQATLDTDIANVQSLEAQVAEQKATIAKKNIQAPFSGQLGINLVNPGQYINVGDSIVTLQTLTPIYIDFYVPQQKIVKLKKGQAVKVTSDAYPNQVFSGKITTINPIVDIGTRNVAVEATLSNKAQQLLPGMFAHVEVDIGKPISYLTLPLAAISYHPYGEIVYVVVDESKDNKGEKKLVAKQKFVTTGENRGDQVAIIKGLEAGEKVVTSGQLKLKNGSLVTINNSVQMSNSPDPKVSNEQ